MGVIPFPFTRFTILAISLAMVLSILHSRQALLLRAIGRPNRSTGWSAIVVLILAPVSLLYSSLVSILSIVASGFKAILFPASQLYQGAPWLRSLFVGNLFWLLVALCLVWFFMRQFQTRTNRCTWHLSRLETLSLYTVTTATLAEIMGQGQNLFVDFLGSSLSSKAPSDLEAVSFYLLVGNVFFAVILVCVVWMVHRSWSKE